MLLIPGIALSNRLAAVLGGLPAHVRACHVQWLPDTIVHEVTELSSCKLFNDISDGCKEEVIVLKCGTESCRILQVSQSANDLRDGLVWPSIRKVVAWQARPVRQSIFESDVLCTIVLLGHKVVAEQR